MTRGTPPMRRSFSGIFWIGTSPSTACSWAMSLVTGTPMCVSVCRPSACPPYVCTLQHYPDGVEGDQLGRDFVSLSALVDSIFPPDRRPLLLGPDVCGPGRMEGDSKCSTVAYCTSILTSSEGVLDAVTIHHYGKSVIISLSGSALSSPPLTRPSALPPL